MGMHRIVVLWGWLLVVACTMQLHAAEPPPIPDKPEAEMFKDAPAPWRDYLIKARAAERIADPLQRCLAFPDIPGNRWPAGHAAAHCREHFADKPLTPARIGEMLDRGEVKQIDDLLEARLQRHFSETDFSEIIHYDLGFDQNDAGETKRVAESWLRVAPNSAFANLAYANVVAHSAWEARGGAYAAETPKENMRRMHELAQQALPYYEKAIALNKRLMPAYAELINLAKLDSMEGVGERAFRSANEIDPACSQIIFEHMSALSPRWGGDYEEMLAYVKQISGYVVKRPQLAVYQANPYEDLGSLRISDDQYTKETLQILDEAVSIASGEASLGQAADVAGRLTDGEPDRFKQLGYLLQAARFQEIPVGRMQMAAWRLVGYEPEWSLKYALAAIETKPDAGLSHYLAGAGYYDIRRYGDADREYRIAIEDAEQRQASLREVAEMWMWQGDMQQFEVRKANAARAKPYIDRLVREYPHDGRGAIMAFWNDVFVNKTVREPAVRSALKKVDRSDPWQARRAEQLEGMLKQIEQFSKQKPR